MNIVNIHGGLGNQMFQYAFGLAIEHESGLATRYAIDMFDGYKLHNGLELDKVFDLSLDVAGPNELSQMLGMARWRWARRILGRVGARSWLVSRFIQEIQPSYMPSVLEECTGAYFQGYWQSEKYFSSIAPHVRMAFVFRDPDCVASSDLANAIKSSNSVAVHIRRGDYLSGRNVGIYASCGLDYYRRAIDCVVKSVGDVKLFVFGDDPAWASSTFAELGCSYEIVRAHSGVESYKDMLLMSLARHNIISNSTFSWWAAWLNRNPSKMVVAPSQWYKGVNANVQDMIPSDWVRVAI